MMVHGTRGLLERARGRDEEALAAFRAADAQAELLVTPHFLALHLRVHALQALTRMGECGHVEQALAELDEQERETAQARSVVAALRLAQDDPQAAADALAPVLEGNARGLNPAPLDDRELQRELHTRRRTPLQAHLELTDSTPRLRIRIDGKLCILAASLT